MRGRPPENCFLRTGSGDFYGDVLLGFWGVGVKKVNEAVVSDRRRGKVCCVRIRYRWRDVLGFEVIEEASVAVVYGGSGSRVVASYGVGLIFRTVIVRHILSRKWP